MLFVLAVCCCLFLLSQKTTSWHRSRAQPHFCGLNLALSLSLSWPTAWSWVLGAGSEAAHVIGLTRLTHDRKIVKLALVGGVCIGVCVRECVLGVCVCCAWVFFTVITHAVGFGRGRCRDSNKYLRSAIKHNLIIYALCNYNCCYCYCCCYYYCCFFIVVVGQVLSWISRVPFENFIYLTWFMATFVFDIPNVFFAASSPFF